MGEHRKPTLTMLIKRPGDNDTSTKVEVFPASLWCEDYPTTDAYRVRIDGNWHDKGHAAADYAIAYLSWQSVMSICSKIGANLIAPEVEEPAPVTPDQVIRGCRVRIFMGDMDFSRTTFTSTNPFQSAEGEWMVYVAGEKLAIPLSRIHAVVE